MPRCTCCPRTLNQLSADATPSGTRMVATTIHGPVNFRKSPADGRVAPGDYNKAWWELKAQYQGVAPASPRGEEFFDPGAKYHVPGNTPYTRYFLSHVLQFQFYKALCDASGHEGPLHTCNFAGNKEAGAKFWAMLQKGQSQPWQKTMKELTGTETMDASAVLEYFAPLQSWLEEKNQGKQCGF